MVNFAIYSAKISYKIVIKVFKFSVGWGGHLLKLILEKNL